MGGSSSRPIPRENTRRTRRRRNNNNNNDNNDKKENENAPKKACNKIETVQRLVCKDIDHSDIVKVFKKVYSRVSDREETVDTPNIRTTAKTQLTRLRELVCKEDAKKLEKDDVKALAKKIITLTKDFKDE